MLTNEFEIYLDEQEAKELKQALKCSGLVNTRRFNRLIEEL